MPEESDHVHELINSERAEDFGTLYCLICDKNFADIPDDDEIVMK